MTEEFVDVPGFEGLYQVSTQGRVKSLLSDGTIMSTTPPKGKYLQVNLHKNGKAHNKYVHRLVLLTFVGPCPKGQEVRHLDGDRTNNNLSNLRYGTRKENVRDAIKHGTHARGERQGASTLKKEQVIEIRKLSESGLSQRAIASKYGVSQNTVWKILTGRSWTHIQPSDS